MIRNIALTLRFDGTNYHGWQSQKNATAICDVVSKAILKVTGEPLYPCLEGCGRTDAGVHALSYIANFKTSSSIPTDRFPLALNPLLPPDIAVMEAHNAPEDFHARFSCISKEYIYKIYGGRIHDPLLHNRALHWPYPLDVTLMQEAAPDFLGRHDFSAFRSTGSNVKTTERTVLASDVETSPDGMIIFRVRADGFLYNMVRIMAGTLVYIGNGKLPPRVIPEILKNGGRPDSGITLPPHGLYLSRLWY